MQKEGLRGTERGMPCEHTGRRGHAAVQRTRDGVGPALLQLVAARRISSGVPNERILRPGFAAHHHQVSEGGAWAKFVYVLPHLSLLTAAACRRVLEVGGGKPNINRRPVFALSSPLFPCIFQCDGSSLCFTCYRATMPGWTVPWPSVCASAAHVRAAA